VSDPDSEAGQPGALDGIRVVEIGLLVQGPQAASMLGDLGAEVIKVALPGFGDQARWIPASASERRSGYYVGCNRGKRSITLDVRTPAGRDAFLRLADTADVVISNFKPGTMESWGVGYEQLAARNPGVVYGAGSTFGSRGTDALREGADIAGQAAGGLISTTGRDGDDPTPVGVTISDHISSQHLAAGLLAALFARTRSGRGQKVEVSLLGGQIYAQASEYTAYLMSGEVPGRSNRGHPLINGLYGVLPTKDGHIAVVGVLPAARPTFAELVGMPGLFDDPRFAPPLIPADHKQQLFDLLTPAFAARTTAEWAAALREAGVRYAEVRDYAAVVADPQARENGYLVDVVHPEWGPITVVGSPLQMSETPPRPGVVAPALGAHTEEVLLELGYSWDEIGELRKAAAI